MGIAGAGALLAASPWLSAFSEITNTSNEKCRLAVIGPGSRGRFLMSFLVKNPKVEIVNVGAEEEKGNALVKETFPLLKECKSINFI